MPAAVLGMATPLDLTCVNVVALLDTGATCSAISHGVISQLGLRPHEKRHLRVATEDRLVEYYFFRIGLFPDLGVNNPASAALPFVFAELDGFGMRNASEFDVIIGMDVLRQCDFQFDRRGHWQLEFG